MGITKNTLFNHFHSQAPEITYSIRHTLVATYEGMIMMTITIGLGGIMFLHENKTVEVLTTTYSFQIQYLFPQLPVFQFIQFKFIFKDSSSSRYINSHDTKTQQDRLDDDTVYISPFY